MTQQRGWPLLSLKSGRYTGKTPLVLQPSLYHLINLKGERQYVGDI